MRAGLTLAGDLLDADGAKFAARLHHVSTTAFDMAAIDPHEPIPDDMVWNMRCRDGRTNSPPVRVSDAELWDRLGNFLRALVPAAAEAGVALDA